MYSRNYGFSEDTPSKINPPPDYSGSAIQSGEISPFQKNEQAEQNFPQNQSRPAFSPSAESGSEEKREREQSFANVPPPLPPCDCGARCEHAQRPCESEPPKKDKGILSGFLSDMCTEDLILIGIIAALAFGFADKDILLVALVVAVVLM